ncbi:hypothetical protein, partial [Parachitinimonas caeni]
MVSQGELGKDEAGQTTVVKGERGVALTYNYLNQRTQAAYGGKTDAGYGQYAHTENYGYSLEGYLTRVTSGGAVVSERKVDSAGRTWKTTDTW